MLSLPDLKTSIEATYVSWNIIQEKTNKQKNIVDTGQYLNQVFKSPQRWPKKNMAFPPKKKKERNIAS